jgi:hypothetical protein
VVTLEAPAVMMNAFRNFIQSPGKKTLLGRLRRRALLHGVSLLDG